MEQRQRPHMAFDRRHLLFTDSKILSGIHGRNVRMVIAVQVIPMYMPVIEKIVMQESRAHQPPLIGLQVKPSVHQEGLPCYAHTMVVGRNPAVLNVIFHAKGPRIQCDDPNMLLKLSFLNAR